MTARTLAGARLPVRRRSMPHRVFQDRAGRIWQAWAVAPAEPERRGEDEAAVPPDVEQRRRRRIKVSQPQWPTGGWRSRPWAAATFALPSGGLNSATRSWRIFVRWRQCDRYSACGLKHRSRSSSVAYSPRSTTADAARRARHAGPGKPNSSPPAAALSPSRTPRRWSVSPHMEGAQKRVALSA